MGYTFTDFPILGEIYSKSRGFYERKYSRRILTTYLLLIGNFLQICTSAWGYFNMLRSTM